MVSSQNTFLFQFLHFTVFQIALLSQDKNYQHVAGLGLAIAFSSKIFIGAYEVSHPPFLYLLTFGTEFYLYNMISPLESLCFSEPEKRMISMADPDPHYSVRQIYRAKLFYS